MARACALPTITDDRALGGAVIERSLRFNRSDAPYLQATLGDGNDCLLYTSPSPRDS